MANKIPLIDRLQDRGFIDQWGFMAFAGIGFVAIISTKAIGINTTWVAAGAVLSMILYALIIGRSGTGRLRADQAGDNCYYLGLIYTLASLSYAIATFDPSNTASTIVQGFGIALATTIVGLILRVYFSQGRPDLENVEEQARLELTEASTRLKAELNGVVRQMNDFSRELQQSMQEMHEAATKNIEDFTKSSVLGLQSVVETANAAMSSESSDFTARSKKYSTSFNALLGKLEQHSATLEQLNTAHSAIASTADVAKDAAASALSIIEALHKTAGGATAAATAAESASTAASHSARQLADTVGDFEESLARIRQETDKQIAELAAGPGTVAANTIATVNSACEALVLQIEQIAALHDNIRSGLADQTSVAVEASKRHNNELEAELARSRGLVTKVHSALADMTDSIAKTVEGTA